MGTGSQTAAPETVSQELERWLQGEQHTLDSLIELFGKRSFALLFVILLGVPALPLPTGGTTHVFEFVLFHDLPIQMREAQESTLHVRGA